MNKGKIDNIVNIEENFFALPIWKKNLEDISETEYKEFKRKFRAFLKKEKERIDSFQQK